MPVRFHFVKFESLKFVSRASIRTFSLELFHIQLITFIALEKCKRGCNMLDIILVQGFCPLKIKVIQFPNGFRLLVYFS